MKATGFVTRRGEMRLARSIVLAALVGAFAAVPEGCGSSPASSPAASSAATPRAVLSVGAASACVVLSDGTVSCWGDNELGQLGIDQGRADSKLHTPGLVSGVQGAVAVATRGAFSCALLSSAQVDCWGRSGSGTQAGSYPATVVQGPAAGQTLGGVTALSVGWTEACAVTGSGSLYCWGSSTPLATAVQGSGYVDVAVGRDHLCAVTSDGKVWCQGANDRGQLGSSGAGEVSPAMAQVPSITTARSVSAGDRSTCVLLASGMPQCWGAVPAFEPVAAPSLNLASVKAGAGFACGLTPDGHVVCWGANEAQQIGGPSLGGFVGEPYTIPGVANAVSLSVGEGTTCAVIGDGSVQCWGADFAGEAGNGVHRIIPSATPFAVALPGGARASGT